LSLPDVGCCGGRGSVRKNAVVGRRSVAVAVRDDGDSRVQRPGDAHGLGATPGAAPRATCPTSGLAPPASEAIHTSTSSSELISSQFSHVQSSAHSILNTRILRGKVKKTQFYSKFRIHKLNFSTPFFFYETQTISFTAKTKPLFQGVLYLIWVLNLNGVSTYFVYLPRLMYA